jgi:23S rRNA (adenine2503-C2)-methyltransferase
MIIEKIPLSSYTKEEIEEFIQSIGQPKYRGGQIFTWIQKGIVDFDEISNLKKDFRNLLKEKCEIEKMEIVERFDSKADGTKKYLFSLKDGNIVESVFMKYSHGNSVCITTQVGCKMGCLFCASTGIGFMRNLSAGEMLAQVARIQKDTGERVSNIVLMGIGEPLDNFDNVVKFLKLVNHEDGLNIGHRHISISTCGLVPEINKLANLHMQVTLSISLHGPDDETRNKIMPVNKAYPVKELIKACKNYFNKTKRRISFEYAMINGVNDSKEQAIKLAKLIKGMPTHVNLIPMNDVKGSSLSKSKNENIQKFKKYLIDMGINTTVRRELGSDIDAACGQLRRSYMEEK